jgi:2-iminobutanoate/2-iminopropanoate deaminase
MFLSARLAAAALAGTGLLAIPALGEVKTFKSPLTPAAPYSGATRAGNMIFVGGIIGLEPNGKTLVPGGIKEEAEAAFRHVITMLERAGGKRSDIAKCVVLLSDINYFPEMNKVFTSYFPTSPPTRSTIVVPVIPMNAAIEVECTAIL